MKKATFINIFFLLSAMFFYHNSFALTGSVAIICDQQNATYTFAASEIKNNIEQPGNKVVFADIKNLSSTIASTRIILTARGTDEANSFVSNSGVAALPASASQGYSIRKKIYSTHTDWYIIGFDKCGTMYGALDLGEAFRFNTIENLANADKKPYIKNRGIKFNIPLDARTPGYSDNSDVAQSNIINMWDDSFWYRFLNDMAKYRLNMLSLWSLAPFPSMVNVPAYPNASLSDVKKTTAPLNAFQSLTGDNMSNAATRSNLATVKTLTINEKIKFWQHIMQYASDRGIDFYLFAWNTFVYGTENSGYGFTDDVTDNKTKDYFRQATKALLITYPLLKGIGITAGENMKGNAAEKEMFLSQSYGLGINDALALDERRTFTLIHRTIQTNVPAIKSAFATLNARCSVAFSYKYSQAHLYSSTKPDYIEKDNFLKSIGNSNYYFTVRDDDWYYLRGGSDPAFARAYISNMPAENFNGFYMGPDGYTWGKEYISKNKNFEGELVADKRWYCFEIWGKLAYDHTLPDAYFVKVLKARFPHVNAQNLFTAWSKASQVIPMVNRFHNVGAQMDYQWYPEACNAKTGFHNVDRFINTNPQSGEGLMSIPEYANAVINNVAMAAKTPLQVAKNLEDNSNEALALTKGISGKDNELLQTIEDIKAMAWLGKYYSKKIIGATYKCLSDKTTDTKKKAENKLDAIKSLQNASDCWRTYAAILSKSYSPQYLTRIQRVVDVSAMQADVDKDILLAQLNPVAANTTVTIAYRLGLSALELATSEIYSALQKLHHTTHLNLSNTSGD